MPAAREMAATVSPLSWIIFRNVPAIVVAFLLDLLIEVLAKCPLPVRRQRPQDCGQPVKQFLYAALIRMFRTVIGSHGLPPFVATPRVFNCAAILG